MERAEYFPPWANTSIIGIAGSSGSGKTSLAKKIVASLDLPWVIILSMDSFYKILTPEQHALAHRNEYDLDSPNAIDFELLVEKLRDLKEGRVADIPMYSFENHQRLETTNRIYSPHVLILEGIFALYDEQILDMLDMKIFAEADADLCLARRSMLKQTWFCCSPANVKTKQVTRDVKERGRDLEGCIKQWISWVKPNFQKFVEPQRNRADIIVPRGIENAVAIGIIVEHIQQMLKEKSRQHQEALQKLGEEVEDEPISENVMILAESQQIKGMNTIIQNPDTNDVDFIFYFDRMSTLLVERAMENVRFESTTVATPQGSSYRGLKPSGEVSAVVILRAGSCLETGLKRVIPDCRTGRILIQTDFRTGEPELHYLKLPADIRSHDNVLLLDTQMSSGGAALMAVKVLVDHGVPGKNIVFVTYYAGKMGVNRLLKVFPDVKIVVCGIVEDFQERWIERRYFGC